LVVFETNGPLIVFAEACEDIGLRIVADDEVEFDDDEGIQTKGHYYLTMPDQRAIEELLRLWKLWGAERDLGQHAKWARIFGCLHSLRRWGPKDRVTDEDAAAISEDAQLFPQSNVRLEIELAFEPSDDAAASHRAQVMRSVEAAGGRVTSISRISEIAYDALLVDVGNAAAQAIAQRTDDSLARLVDVFSIRPQSVLNVTATVESEPTAIVGEATALGPPIAAILDAVPQQNHVLIGPRIAIEDFLGLEGVTIGPRVHGTAMASLVIHGDLAKNEPALSRRVTFLPIMYSAVNDPNFVDEAPPANRLIVDILVQAIRRLKVGDADSPPVAPDVLIVNLSIGDAKRPFGSRISAFARAIDWLAATYGILFLISAGNSKSLLVPGMDLATFAGTAGEQRTRATLSGLRWEMHSRRLLPPSEAMNCLAIGALHDDEIAAAPDMGQSRDPLPVGVFATPVSRMGLGYRSSIKPDLLFPGGRLRALLQQSDPTVARLVFDGGNKFGGLRAAGPGVNAAGVASQVQHSGSTSAATALATRACHLIHDALETAYADDFMSLPADARAVIIKALIVHRAFVPEESRSLINDVFGPPGRSDGGKRKANVQRIFGFGVPDIEEVLGCVISRATLWGEGVIGENEAKVFSFPLPVSLSGVRGPRKLSVTLAWFTPVQAGRRAYRGVRLKVEEPKYKAICSSALDGQPDRRPRGTIYHRFWEGRAARNFVAGDTVEFRVARDPDQGDQLPDVVRFGLAATLETDDETLPIYEEVRARLLVRPRIPVLVGG
jgi:hypothetical protein